MRPTPPPSSERYLRGIDVARIFNVSPKTVTRWADERKLAHFKTLGGHRRYPESEVRALIDQLTQHPAE